MELDQLIFQKISNYFSKRRKADPALLARSVHLEETKGRLTIMARALTGEAIDIISSEREGGWKDRVFFLPKSMGLFPSAEDNMLFYYFRLFYLVTQKKLGFNYPPDRGDTSPAEAREKARETSGRVLQALFKEYPRLENIHQKLWKKLPRQDEKGREIPPDTSWLYGRWMKNETHNSPAELENICRKAQETKAGQITTTLKARQADEIEVLEVDKKSQEEYTLTHNFEKVETADEFNGAWRDFDGDDHLNEEGNALNEFNLNKVVRVDDPVHSVYQAEFVGKATIAESKEQEAEGFHLLYDEWDFSRRTYKQNYCKVYPKKVSKTQADYYAKTLEHNRSALLQLRKMFARLNNERMKRRRMSTGENLDIDALTDMYADLAAGHTPDERVYISSRKRQKELSMLFLLDLSLSSDAYARGNRIIDVEKQVSILFGEVLNEYMIDFQIDGFFSKTRNNTSYLTLKAFDEPWNKGKMRIGSVQPAGYTRIGPALRHATGLLRKRPHRNKKWLILLSDGKPTDYDRYEGRYGIEDIKQALREMQSYGIENFALAIEEQAKYYLPQMFGQNHYNILSSPMEMITALAKLYKRLIK